MHWFWAVWQFYGHFYSGYKYRNNQGFNIYIRIITFKKILIPDLILQNSYLMAMKQDTKIVVFDLSQDSGCETRVESY